jgi:hypothetical protein
MKKCPYCGLENADDAVTCTTCRTEFVASPTPLPEALSNEYLISPEEWRYWNRMTFRQFAVVIVRLAALWCFFEAVLELVSIVRYTLTLPYMLSTSRYGSPFGMDFYVFVLRVGIRVVAGFLLIFNGEKILSWLVKDGVQRQPPEISRPTPASGPSV